MQPWGQIFSSGNPAQLRELLWQTATHRLGSPPLPLPLPPLLGLLLAAAESMAFCGADSRVNERNVQM